MTFKVIAVVVVIAAGFAAGLAMAGDHGGTPRKSVAATRPATVQRAAAAVSIRDLAAVGRPPALVKPKRKPAAPRQPITNTPTQPTPTGPTHSQPPPPHTTPTITIIR